MSHSGDNQLGIANRGERNKADSVEGLPGLLPDLESKTRLADATGSRQRDETHVVAAKQGGGSSYLPLPADELAQLCRQRRNVLHWSGVLSAMGASEACSVAL